VAARRSVFEPFDVAVDSPWEAPQDDEWTFSRFHNTGPAAQSFARIAKQQAVLATRSGADHDGGSPKSAEPLSWAIAAWRGRITS
jgi:hypothetical protein